MHYTDQGERLEQVFPLNHPWIPRVEQVAQSSLSTWVSRMFLIQKTEECRGQGLWIFTQKIWIQVPSLPFVILCGIIKNTSLHLGPNMQLQEGSPQNKQETQRIQSRRASNTVSNRGDKTQSLPIFDEEMGIIDTLLSSYFYSIPARVTINEQSWGCKREWWGLCPSKAGSSHQL